MKYILCFLLVASSAFAKKEKNMPERFVMDLDTYLLCKEHTIKYAYVIKIAYVGLYLKNCNTQQNVYDLTDKLIRFNYQLDVKAKVFIDAAKEFYIKNSQKELSNQEIQELDKFNQLYVNINKSDYYDIFHQQNNYLKLYKNTEFLGSSSNGDFASKYFNIWFGKEPSVKSLKKAFSH